jgi:hypothetical protein
MRREMVGMGNVSEVSLLRIVTSAELELPFGSRAKNGNGGQAGEF